MALTKATYSMVTGAPNNVLDFGADPTGVADSTAAIQAALDAGGEVYVPEGTYKVQSLTVTKEVRLIGEGRKKTLIDFYTTSDDGIVWDGDSAFGLSSSGFISGMSLTYKGTGTPNKSGIKLTRKVNAFDVVVDGFSGHGIEFVSVDANTQTPYFCNFQSVASVRNGWSGIRIRDNCNANVFVDCQFNSNGNHGFHQELSSLATYGTVIIGGQCSYNEMHGYYFPNCTNYNVVGIYAEYNNQSGAGGVSPGDTLNGTYKDLYIGPNVTYSVIRIGVLIGNQIGRVTINTQITNDIWLGGQRIAASDNLPLGFPNAGSGKTLTFNGFTGCTHLIEFVEGSGDPTFIVEYDGVSAAPDNRLIFRSKHLGVDYEQLRMSNDGKLRFFGGGSTQSRPTVTGSRDGNAALASLLTALDALGLVTDSTS